MPTSTPQLLPLVKVYDLRMSTYEQRALSRSRSLMLHEGLIFNSEPWWSALQECRIPIFEARGPITRVWFKNPKSYTLPKFRIGKGPTKTEWIRKAPDDQVFKVGKMAVVKYVQLTPPPEFGELAAAHNLALPPLIREYEVWVEA